MKKQELADRLEIVENFLGRVFRDFEGFSLSSASDSLQNAAEKIPEILRAHPEQCLSRGFCIGGEKCGEFGCIRQTGPKLHMQYSFDPPWFADLIAAAHRAWLDSGGGNGSFDQPINFYAIVRAVISCHDEMIRSPTIENEAEAIADHLYSHFGGKIIGWQMLPEFERSSWRQAARDLLSVAAKARLPQ